MISVNYNVLPHGISIGKIIHPNSTSSINIFFEKLDKTQLFNMATGYDNKLDSDQCVHDVEVLRQLQPQTSTQN